MVDQTLDLLTKIETIAADNAIMRAFGISENLHIGVSVLSPAFLYNVYYQNNHIYARNLSTNKIQFNGDDLSTVLRSVFNALPSRTSKVGIKITGDFGISRNINIPSYVTVDATNAVLHATDCGFIRFSGVHHSDFIKGLVGGASQTDGNINARVIEVSDSSYITVKNTEIVNSGYYGLNILRTKYSTFDSIYAHNNYRHGIHVGPSSSSGYGNVISNCRSNRNGVSGIADRGLTVSGNIYNTYRNNTTNSNGDNGFVINTAGGYSVNISNATSRYNGKDGMDLYYIKAKIDTINTSNNKGNGIDLNGVQNSTFKNVTSNSNGKIKYNAGLKITDSYNKPSKNISISCGTVKNNWRNLYVAYSNVPNSNILFKDIDARGSVNANVYIQSGQTNITLQNVLR